MKSSEELRGEARHLRNAARDHADPKLKKELARQALDLAQRAEAADRLQEDVDIIRLNIERYHSLLANGLEDENQRALVVNMLRDAECLLAKKIEG